MSITVLIVMIAVSMMMIMTIQALEPLPLRVAPILKPPSSSTIFQTKSTDIKHKNIHLQGKTALLYGGSPVVHIPRVYLVFWGSQWINNDPSGEAAIIISLMQGIGGTTWLNTVTQYCSDGSIGSTSCVGKARITNPSSILKGIWYDNSVAAPISPTQNQFGIEAIRAAAYFRQNTSTLTTDALYFIMSATGNNIAQFGSSFCAYHDYRATTFGNVIFANIPYITDVGYSCGAGFNGLANNAGISINVGHELIEMITDPLCSGGWIDRNNSEIGDKCGFIGTGSPGAVTNIQLPTGTFPMQSIWSNVDANCVLTFGTVAPTSGPTSSPTVSIQPTSPTATPTSKPTSPTVFPTSIPSARPTSVPTRSPITSKPTQPTVTPTRKPSTSPSVKPSVSLAPGFVKAASTSQGIAGTDLIILVVVVIVLALLVIGSIFYWVQRTRVSKQAASEEEFEEALSSVGIDSRNPSRRDIDPARADSGSPNLSPSNSSRGNPSSRGVSSRGVSSRGRMLSVDSDTQDVMYNSSFREFVSDNVYDPVNSTL